jgi:hypothetical protein
MELATKYVAKGEVVTDPLLRPEDYVLTLDRPNNVPQSLDNLAGKEVVVNHMVSRALWVLSNAVLGDVSAVTDPAIGRSPPRASLSYANISEPSRFMRYNHILLHESFNDVPLLSAEDNSNYRTTRIGSDLMDFTKGEPTQMYWAAAELAHQYGNSFFVQEYGVRVSNILLKQGGDDHAIKKKYAAVSEAFAFWFQEVVTSLRTIDSTVGFSYDSRTDVPLLKHMYTVFVNEAKEHDAAHVLKNLPTIVQDALPNVKDISVGPPLTYDIYYSAQV